MSITKNTTYIRTIKHTPINDYPCLIKLSQTRYKCNYCKKSFNQSTSLVIKGCYISAQTKDQILKESKEKQSFKDVSKRTNVSQTTISNEYKKILTITDVT